MKIAFITPEFPTEDSYSGGLANYLGRVTVALAAKGHEVHCFTKSFVRDETIDYRGVNVHRVIPLWDRKMRIDKVDRLVPRKLYAPYQDLKACWCLWRRWKQENKKGQFHVVQLANVLAVGLFFRWESRVVTVTRLSSYRPVWDRAAGVEPSIGVRCRWWMERVAIKATKFVYAPTYYVAKLTEENYGVERIRVIETPFFHEEPEADYSLYRQMAENKDYVLFFGRMTQMKGVHRLAESLVELMKEHPEMLAVFIGGSGKAPDGSEMHDYIRMHLGQYGERLIVMESVRHHQLYPFVENAKVVAIPSLMDNLPNTCLESMGLGRIVVATEGTCFEQLIEPGKSGFLALPDNASSLKSELRKAWLLDEAKRRGMSAAAKKRIAQLDPEIKVPELIEYYHEIIDLF